MITPQIQSSYEVGEQELRFKSLRWNFTHIYLDYARIKFIFRIFKKSNQWSVYN